MQKAGMFSFSLCINSRISLWETRGKKSRTHKHLWMLKHCDGNEITKTKLEFSQALKYTYTHTQAHAPPHTKAGTEKVHSRSSKFTQGFLPIMVGSKRKLSAMKQTETKWRWMRMDVYCIRKRQTGQCAKEEAGGGRWREERRPEKQNKKKSE